MSTPAKCIPVRPVVPNLTLRLTLCVVRHGHGCDMGPRAGGRGCSQDPRAGMQAKGGECPAWSDVQYSTRACTAMPTEYDANEMVQNPLGGRSFESFSEDPHLNGMMASSYIARLQGEGISACIKHFVCVYAHIRTPVAESATGATSKSKSAAAQTRSSQTAHCGRSICIHSWFLRRTRSPGRT